MSLPALLNGAEQRLGDCLLRQLHEDMLAEAAGDRGRFGGTSSSQSEPPLVAPSGRCYVDFPEACFRPYEDAAWCLARFGTILGARIARDSVGPKASLLQWDVSLQGGSWLLPHGPVCFLEPSEWPRNIRWTLSDLYYLLDTFCGYLFEYEPNALPTERGRVHRPGRSELQGVVSAFIEAGFASGSASAFQWSDRIGPTMLSHWVWYEGKPDPATYPNLAAEGDALLSALRPAPPFSFSLEWGRRGARTEDWLGGCPGTAMIMRHFDGSTLHDEGLREPVLSVDYAEALREHCERIARPDTSGP